MRRREFVAGDWQRGGSAARGTGAAAGGAGDRAISPHADVKARMTEPYDVAFRQGLREQGYVEGRNVEILYRLRPTRTYDRLSALAAELVRGNVAVIAALGAPVVALAAKIGHVRRFPIVFDDRR